MSGWLLVRIAAIVVGTFSLLRLATSAEVVSFTAAFQSWMDRLRDFVELGFLLDAIDALIVQPMLEVLRQYGLQIPQLQDHWKQVFVLAWLSVSSVSRVRQEGDPPKWAQFAISSVCILPFCVATGTASAGSISIVLWPLAGFLMFVCIYALLGREYEAAKVVAVLSAGSAVLGYFADDTISAGGNKISYATIASALIAGYLLLLGFVRLSYGEFAVGLICLAVGILLGASGYYQGNATAVLLVLVGLVAVWAMLSIQTGMEFGEGSWQQRLNSPDASPGLDILAALFGAFGIAALVADPPLF